MRCFAGGDIFHHQLLRSRFQNSVGIGFAKLLCEFLNASYRKAADDMMRQRLAIQRPFELQCYLAAIENGNHGAESHLQSRGSVGSLSERLSSKAGRLPASYQRTDIL